MFLLHNSHTLDVSKLDLLIHNIRTSFYLIIEQLLAGVEEHLVVLTCYSFFLLNLLPSSFILMLISMFH